MCGVEQLKKLPQLCGVIKIGAKFFKKRLDFRLSFYHLIFMHIGICIEASEARHKSAIFYANLRVDNLGYELNDASKAIEIDANHVEAYYSRATAHRPPGKSDEASSDLSVVGSFKNKVNAETENKDFRVAEKTMKMGGVRGESDSIDIDAISVESDYSGPKFEDGKITKEFILELIEYYKAKKKLHKKYAFKILRKVRNYYRRQPSLMELKVPRGQNITICGDIHGQLFDLLNIFKINGYPSETNRYLFNGDFVDRGRYSVECVIILFAFKLLHPNRVFLNRGNHESKMMNHYYGFADECRFKYSDKMMNVFSEVFQWLPLAHRLNQKVLVLHAGLFSQDGVTLADIKHIERNCEPVHNQIMFDMLWSDPKESEGRAPNFMRGAGIEFGPDVTRAFCIRNQVEYIIRSHFPTKEGYALQHNGRLITVFSAPNYYGNNKGAIVKLCGPALAPKFTTFTQTPDPSWETSNIVVEDGKKITNKTKRRSRSTPAP